MELIVTILVFTEVFEKQYGKKLHYLGRGYYMQLKNIFILEYMLSNYWILQNSRIDAIILYTAVCVFNIRLD